MILRLEKHAEVLTSDPNVSVLGSDMQLGFHRVLIPSRLSLCLTHSTCFFTAREGPWIRTLGTNIDVADMAGKLND